MGIYGTYSQLPIRALFLLAIMALLTACEIDDAALCDDQYPSQNDTACQSPIGQPLSFKLEYTTANGTRPDGRYGYTPSGAAATDADAEAECQAVLQSVFDSTPAAIDFEASEIVQYRGNICGAGFTLRHGLGDFKVKRVRRTGANTFDYDLELTCIY